MAMAEQLEEALLQSRRNESGRGCWRTAVDVVELKLQLQLAVPMALTNMSYYAILLISVMFAGHIGDVELAGATLANSWAVVTGFAFSIGLSGALETYCGQNFGAEVYSMLGVHFQTLIIVSFMFCIPISILWFYTEPVLILFHQDLETSKMAALYLKHLIPGIFAYSFLQCILRFFQTQSVVMPLVICSLIPVFLHVGLTYLVVRVWGFGFIGAPISVSISLWFSFLMLALYMNFSSRFQRTWTGLSMDCFMYIFPSLKLAIPSAVMVCLEFWAFEILVLLAGLMSNSTRSTSVIAMCVSTETIIYNVIYGFGAAVSTRVSNELGSGQGDNAKSAIATTMKLSIFVSAVFNVSLIFANKTWASFFSDSTLVIHDFSSMVPLLAVSLLVDSAQGVLSGVARGCGWQNLAAWTNLAAFYGVGMPVSVVFGFVFDFREKGLWLGLICGLSCQTGALLLHPSGQLG